MARLKRSDAPAPETETTRLFLLLLIGTLLAAGVTFAALGFNHHSRLSQSHDFTTAERIVDLAGIGADPVAALMTGLPGASGQKLGSPDPALTQAVAAAFRRRGIEGVTVKAYHAPTIACGGVTEHLRCRILVLRPHGGTAKPVAISLPPAPRPWTLNREAAALLAVGLAGVLLTGWMASRLAAGPLNRLSEGAVALSHDLDRPPLIEEGAREVRQAAAALNAMQTRLQTLIEDRTRVLAAVAHDLQTPLTRMRLRIEKVEDEALRAQLVNDLGAMQHLVREGLDLARIETTAEDVVPVDLDALLSALCEDAADAGQPVVFAGGLFSRDPHPTAGAAPLPDQSGGQRRASWRRRRGDRRASGIGNPPDRARPRPRRARRPDRPPLRTLLPAGPVAFARQRRLWPWPDHCAAHGRTFRRAPDSDQCQRRGAAGHAGLPRS